MTGSTRVTCWPPSLSPSLRNEYERERATLDSMVADLQKQEIDARRSRLESQQKSDMAGVAIRAAEREFARSQTAWDQRVISERDFQRAKDELDEAKLTHHHSVETATLEKESLQFDLKTRRLQRDRQKLLVADLERRVGELAIKSPVDGVVGTLAVTQKAAVQPDAALLTVVDLSQLVIEFRVAETYAGQIGVAMPADVTYGAKTYRRRSALPSRRKCTRARSRAACACGSCPRGCARTSASPCAS